MADIVSMLKAELPAGYDPRIVDAHHHFWDFQGPINVPWIMGKYDPGFFLGDYHQIRHTFMPEQYRRATRGWNVIGTVHCEVEAQKTQQIEESEWQAALHAEDPRFPMAAVGHAFFLQEDLDEILAAHARIPVIRGIRSKPVIASSPDGSVRGERGALDDPQWRAGLMKLQDYGFSWDLRVPYYHLSEAAEVVEMIPETTVIINHCALPLDRSDRGLALWEKGLRDLASLPNTYIKVSELGVKPNIWDHQSNVCVVQKVIEIFGFKRSMFASNFPVALLTAQSFNDVMAVLIEATRGASEQELDWLFRKTANRAYRLGLAE